MSLEDIVQGIAAGKMTPEEASRRATGSIENFRAFILGLYSRIVQLSSAEQVEWKVLTDLSRFNDLLARRFGDESLRALTALTLFQMLPNDLLNVEEKVQLVEESVPTLEREEREARTMSGIFYKAALAYCALAQISCASEHKKAAIKYARKGLDVLPRGAGVDGWMVEELHGIIGSYLSEIEGATVQDLVTAATHLKESLRRARECGHAASIGQCLNNLGNTMRLLGVRTRDSGTLEEAKRLLNEALPYRAEDSSRRLTEANLRAVEKDMERLMRGAPGGLEQPKPPETEMTAPLGLGEAYLKGSLGIGEEEKQREYLDRAMEKFRRALKASDEAKDPLDQGRAEFGLGVVLNRGKGSLEATLGVCLLQAAARRYEAVGARQRLAAAHLNMGDAYSTILGANGKAIYLSIAAEYLELAWREFAALGAKGQANHCLLTLAACLKLQGEAGDKAAGDRSRELFQKAGLPPEKIRGLFEDA